MLQLAPVALGGPALGHGLGWFGGQAALFGRLNRLLYADPPNMVLLFSERMTASNVRLRGLPNHNIKDSMPFAHEFWLQAR